MVSSIIFENHSPQNTNKPIYGLWLEIDVVDNIYTLYIMHWLLLSSASEEIMKDRMIFIAFIHKLVQGLGLRPANEIRRYFVTTSLIGRAQG